MGSYAFPSEFIKPEIKEKPDYGLQYIMAAWHATDRFGAGMFADDAEINSLIEIAQGRQSTDSMKRLFGKFSDQRGPHDDGPNSLVYIDPQVLNLAPKYINRAVAKMIQREFEVGLETIDLISIEEKADYAASIEAFYRLKEWVEQMDVPLQTAFEGLDVDTLPKYPDEMLYNISTNPKLQREIAGEFSLQLIQTINRMDRKRRQWAWNLVVTGWGHVDCFPDHNGIPRFKVIPHEYWGGSYVDNDDFEEQEYAFYVEPITVNQFRKEAGPDFPQKDIDYLARKYSIQNSNFTDGMYAADKFDNLSYIPVVRFYFLSADNRNYVTRNNRYGSKIMMEKDYNYEPAVDVQHRFAEDGDSKVIRNSYDCVYGGSWIANSNIVYNYGRKNMPRTNLVNTTLPIKTFATNYKKGRAVSFTSQIIEPLYMINVAHNKIKETLAKGWMGIMNIDLSAIEQAALGKGGNVWNAREVVEFLNMTNKAVGRRNAGNQYGQSNGDIVTIQQSGVQLADYFSTMTMYIQILEQMTGTSVVESTNVPDRLPAKAVNASQMSADIDLEYLYNSDHYLYERVCHMLLLLTQEAMKNGTTIQHFIPALGKINTGFYKIPKEIAYCEYGMRLTKKPGPEEWFEFYQDVRLALEAGTQGLPGGIKLSDVMFLREIDNLKQARQIMVIREGQYRREMMQMKQMDNQMAMEANQAAAQAKFQADQQNQQMKTQADAYLKELQGKIDMARDAQKAQLDSMSKRVGDEMAKVIKDVEGKYSVLKEGLKSQATQYDADRSANAKMYAADRSAEAAEKKAAMKPKEKVKK